MEEEWRWILIRQEGSVAVLALDERCGCARPRGQENTETLHPIDG
jgi:hypothetical protein